MKTVTIKAADPLGGKKPEHVIIEISGMVSDDTKPIKSLDDVKKYFDADATKLFYALVDSLPQGVIEPLVIKLLQHRVSLYHGVQS